MHRKLYSGSVPAEDPQPPRKNEATPGDLARLYVRIAHPTERPLSDENRTFLIRLLEEQSFHDRLDKEFPPELKFYHKPGNTSQVAADAGFFYLGQDRIVAVAALQALPSYVPLQKLGKALLELNLGPR